MYSVLSDLRILELAQYLEDTLERYEESLRSLVPQIHVRAALAPLFEGGPGHHALHAIHEELARRAADHAGDMDTHDLLQVMLECERVAHDFYLTQLDHLSDARLIALFTQLAAEERNHMSAVQIAMERLGGLGVETIVKDEVTV